jgi:hypothetical protein
MVVWMVDWKVWRRKGSRPNQGTSLEFVYSGWGQPKNISVDSQWLAKIRKRHRLETNVEHGHYTNLFDRSML